MINFGLIYGMSAFGLAQNLGIERSAAQSYMEKYFARYPSVAAYMDRTRNEARERGYVETVFGRRLWLPGLRRLLYRELLRPRHGHARRCRFSVPAR